MVNKYAYGWFEQGWDAYLETPTFAGFTVGDMLHGLKIKNLLPKQRAVEDYSIVEHWKAEGYDKQLGQI